MQSAATSRLETPGAGTSRYGGVLNITEPGGCGVNALQPRAGAVAIKLGPTFSSSKAHVLSAGSNTLTGAQLATANLRAVDNSTSITLPSAVSLRDALFPEWVSTDDVRGTFVDVTIDNADNTSNIQINDSTTCAVDARLGSLIAATNPPILQCDVGSIVVIRITFTNSSGTSALVSVPSTNVCTIM
jgi:hypothetical protein